jgi:hypothetical protein
MPRVAMPQRSSKRTPGLFAVARAVCSAERAT